MKKIIFIISGLLLGSSVMAQHAEGDWMIGVSSSSLGFNSNTGTEETLDVSFDGFRTDTLVGITDSFNLQFLYPYKPKLENDKKSELDINVHLAYFVSSKFAIGLRGGYMNQTAVYKTGSDQAIIDLHPDSAPGDLMGVYMYNQDLYYDIYATMNNDYSRSFSAWSAAPFVRFYNRLGNGAMFVDASYEIAQGKETLKDDFMKTTITSEMQHGKINFGLGYSLELASGLQLEPQFNYYMLSEKTISTQDVPHPFLNELGTQTTDLFRASNGINFSIGLSYYL
jgi:hypothetical protein